MEPLIIKSQHFKNGYISDFWKNDIVGYKALGLNSLPNIWTPPFIVITMFAYDFWKNESSITKSEIIDKSRFLLKANLKNFVNKLCGGKSLKLIARSSSRFENILERGQYNSIYCNSDINSILDAIINIWSQGNIYGKKVSDKIAIIIQLYVRKITSGHLSNERRISKKSDEWFCEFDEYKKKGDYKIFRFRANKDIGKKFINNELFCKDKKELFEKIKLVTSLSSNFFKRVHYEWVWDSNKLWIVQKDFEEEYEGVSPIDSKKWLVKSSKKKVQKTKLKVLVEASDLKIYWNKIKCINTFKNCGLPSAKIYILEDVSILSELSNGIVNTGLRDDLSWLLNFPIVIRTDIKEDKKFLKFLLPRTDTIFRIQDSINFLVKNSKYFIRNDISAKNFCFLIHRFINSKSSAISISDPNIPKVKIDSTWGLPEGLLYYSHDSFEVSISKIKKIKKYIRCKKEFLDINENGKWVKRFCSKKFDWKSSLKKKNLEIIADYSFKISKYLGKPVQVMFFVDVDKATGHPKCLPWFYTTEIPSKYYIGNGGLKLVEKSMVICNELDLTSLKENLKNNISLRKGHILLKPEPKLLRSNKFINEVSKIALKHNFVIELEGSLLSHIYYILVNKGIRVRCIDVFKPKLKKQIFGKLVRDLIPVIIRSHGEKASTYNLTEDELFPLIKAKVIEEALELYWENDPLKVLEEVADIYECIISIMDIYSWDFEKIKILAEEKRKKRGGFKKGIVLVETREVPLIKKQEYILQDSLIRSMETLDDNRSYRIKYISNIRKPMLKEKKVCIPLIPPNVAEGSKKTIFFLKEIQLEIEVIYKEKEVIIEVKPIFKDLNSVNQLTLFD